MSKSIYWLLFFVWLVVLIVIVFFSVANNKQKQKQIEFLEQVLDDSVFTKKEQEVQIINFD
jgi:preprotein translocase subunit YajC